MLSEIMPIKYLINITETNFTFLIILASIIKFNNIYKMFIKAK
jgi:hypothetical protein